ncbi:DUF885 family protein [Streptomyces sp. YIM 98790]|uniref:DUF885 family protein n=1 Tax=Streptomyces sp. YIM 98790 TaxID=2689077 RepID=UPI0028BE769F|nr:DUF885 family protein [Streptomyces sp. YIM 98790]
MDRAIEELDGTHFDIAGPLRTVESMIAPPGAAAAPHYTPPSMDFSRPGRTWLPTLGETRFPTWPLVSIWYHEGVPGHHLQLAQWRYVADRLSAFQISLGQVSATTEGWALYAERPWARPGSPPGRSSPSGTTRGYPAIISSSPSGVTSPTGCPPSRSAWDR